VLDNLLNAISESVEGVILGAVFNDNTNPDGGSKDVFRVKFPDNSSIEYNRGSHEYTINVKGKVNIISEGETSIEAQVVSVDATMVTIESETVDIQATNVTVSGTLTVSGALTAASLTAASGSISGGGITADGGDLTVTGEISGASVVAGTVDLSTHTHTGVQTGGGTSGPPTP